MPAFVEKRSRYCDVLRFTPFKRRAVIYSHPVNFRDEHGRWRRIKRDLVKDPEKGWQYGVTENNLRCMFKVENGDLYVRLVDVKYLDDEEKARRRSLTYRLNDVKVELGGVEKNRIWFTNPVLDIEFVCLEDRVKETITLKRNPPVGSLKITFLSKRNLTVKREKGRLCFYDPKLGDLVFYFAAPFVEYKTEETDEQGNLVEKEHRDRLSHELDVEARTVTLSLPDWTGLKVKYPVKIDPTTTIQPSIADTYVKSNAADTNFGSSTTARVGHFGGTSYYNCRGLIRFDLSGIPTNAVVESASLYLYVSYIDGGESGTFRPYRILDSWGETTATWNNQPSISDAYDSEKTPPTATGWYIFDVLASTRIFVSNPGDNKGWMIKWSNEGGYNGAARLFDFYTREYATDPSLRPKLVVDYYLKSIPLPRTRVTVKSSTYEYWLETNDYAVYKPSYMEAIQAEQGIPTVNIYLPDPYGEHTHYFAEHYWEPVKVYAIHGGVKKKLLSGLIWDLRVIESARARVLQLVIPSKAIYLTKRMRNYTYSNREISAIAEDLIDVEVPELEAGNYIQPTGETLSTFKAYGVLQDNLTLLTRLALAKTGKEWRWYICNHDHMGELKENLHWERIIRRYEGYDVSPDVAIEFRLTRSYRDLLNEIQNVYSDGSGDYASVTVSDATSQAYDWGEMEGRIFTDRFIVNDSTLAQDYANAILNERKYPDYNGYVVLKGDLTIEPPQLVRVKDYLADKFLAVRKVVHRFSREGFTTMIVFSRSPETTGV